ncbi:2687_t:CDS:2 [Funneliformis caledonium]|uniref:2687_t:CDS:1 n=1 Tax=Funneliformis caledonium TaxID=1117310 RepID=A0A9N9HLX2_9GLOM|nr:2687_t:CDS:2 [Funneliformis caledonium]
MKDHIKEKLDADELCVSMLQKSEEKGLTFDDLWNKKINSAASTEKERMALNSIWVQSVIKTIFDEKHLSIKIDSEVIET